jgi:hypothetical protein
MIAIIVAINQSPLTGSGYKQLLLALSTSVTTEKKSPAVMQKLFQ